MAILMETPASHRSPWRRHGLVLLLLWLLVVACVNLVPVQGWNPSLGPVVPHDTFPADCSLCHQGGDWHTLREDFAFDHGERTGYVLEGAHRDAGCLMCHNDRGPVADFAARGCGGCHADPHLTRLGANCQDCHDQSTWYPREAIAQHDRTRFPLVGAHAAVACFRCHPGAQVGNFAGASAVCGDCHQADYLRTASPNHQQVGFSQQCDSCHLPVVWAPARFDHPASFPLANAHAGRLCSACHTTPNSFSGLSPDCASCHTDDYLTAVEPSHPAAGFGTLCLDCHDTRTFALSPWPHPDSFPLSRGHAGRRCTQCHQSQVYSGTSSDCVTCHVAAFTGAQNPNHVAGGFSTDCIDCHDTSHWSAGQFAHPAAFPLTNAHQRPCTDCHAGNVYTGLDPSCSSCHLTDFQATTNPNHTTAGFGTDCAGCHSTVTWIGAGVVHPATFPLENAHNRACADCHSGGYAGLNPACASCHLADYNGTTDPPHVSFQMSQQCQDCHNTITWGSGSWNHPFPTTGHHNVTCFECHNNPANRPEFSCTHCHDHRQSKMDQEHQGEPGYAWVSSACYQCHPNGNH